MAKIEGVTLKNNNVPIPSVQKTMAKTAERRDLQKRKNRSIAHLKPLVIGETVEMLVKCYPAIEIVKQLKEKYAISQSAIYKIIEDSKKSLEHIGERKLKDAQRNAIAEMEVTKSIFARHIEKVDDETGLKVLDKDASRLFIDAQKRQHTLLGLDKLAIDIRATGAEGLTESELIERAREANAIEIQQDN